MREFQRAAEKRRRKQLAKGARAKARGRKRPVSQKRVDAAEAIAKSCDTLAAWPPSFASVGESRGWLFRLVAARCWAIWSQVNLLIHRFFALGR